jgi:hypothetical protein
MTLTMACMKCNRMVEVGALCPTCSTPEDEEFNRIERESRVKQEYVRDMNRKRSIDDYANAFEELAVARMLIRELTDRLTKLEGKQ